MVCIDDFCFVYGDGLKVIRLPELVRAEGVADGSVVEELARWWWSLLRLLKLRSRRACSFSYSSSSSSA